MLIQRKQNQQMGRAYKIRTETTVPVTGHDMHLNETYKVDNYVVHEGTGRRQLTLKQLEEEYEIIEEEEL